MPLRIKAHVSSETLTIKSPKLAALIGKDVEVVVSETKTNQSSARGFMRGTVIRDDEPFEPAAAPETWEALR